MIFTKRNYCFRIHPSGFGVTAKYRLENTNQNITDPLVYKIQLTECEELEDCGDFIL